MKINPHKNQFLHKYEISHSLGSGGFGKVYTAYRKFDGKSVAIKQIYKKKVGNWVYSADDGIYVPMEYELLKLSQNIQGVMKLYEAYDYSSDVFLLVTEKYKNCQDLFEYISASVYLEESVARRIFSKVVSIVIELEKCNILHRDIKDENIVINTVTNEIMLIDFGCGCITEEKNQRFDYFIGTLVYRPPEWIKYNHYVGSHATVWTLGILLFTLVNGNIPFNNDDEILLGQYRYKRGCISKECTDLISACLNVDHKSRLDLSEILHHPWLSHGSHPSIRN